MRDMRERKPVVFDVIGTTSVSFDAFYDGIHRTIGKRLASHTTQLISFCYSEVKAAQIEFKMISIVITE
jgi:2-haloacid dehalogenase